MGEANKVVSLLIGLFVVIVIFSVVASRLRLPDRLRGLTTTPTEAAVTPTPSVTQQIDVKKQLAQTTITTTTPQTATQEQSVADTRSSTDKGGIITYSSPTVTTPETTKGGVSKIPATGAPTLLLPFALSGLLGGIVLRRKFS